MGLKREARCGRSMVLAGSLLRTFQRFQQERWAMKNLFKILGAFHRTIVVMMVVGLLYPLKPQQTESLSIEFVVSTCTYVRAGARRRFSSQCCTWHACLTRPTMSEILPAFSQSWPEVCIYGSR